MRSRQRSAEMNTLSDTGEQTTPAGGNTMIRQLTKTCGMFVVFMLVVAPLASASTMICSQDEEQVLSSPSGGHAVQKNCLMVKGADGTEVPIKVADAKVGDRLICSMNNGKLECK